MMLFPRKKSQGAPQNSRNLQEELQEQKLMEGSGLLTSKANSGSKEHVKFAVCCKRFFLIVSHSVSSGGSRELSLICMSFTSLSLAENTLCYSMDSSFQIHCSNYVLQPEYGTYVKADG